MAASIAECWRKKWKLGHFSGSQEQWVSRGFRDISFVVPKFSKPARFPPPNHLRAPAERRSRRPKWILRRLKILVKREPALCYRLLRYLNFSTARVASARFIHSACAEPAGGTGVGPVVAYGDDSGHGSGKVFRPGSVVAGAGSILRVGCTPGRHGATDLFLMGMLSLMDAILAVPIWDGDRGVESCP